MPRLASAITLAAALIAGALTATTPALAASHSVSARPHYYLALGDSLSVGIQPNSAGVNTPTSQGYVNDLYANLAATDPMLRLFQLGCAGETTGTLINGGICTYRDGQELSGGVGTGNPAGSQLAAAVAFLHAHKNVSLITIDIGANDLNSCVVLPTISQIQACVEQVLPQIAANLSTIMTALRAAGGSQVRIIGMSYYVPELAAWLTGNTGLATASVPLAEALNNVLATGYQAAGARVADVFTAFDSTDFSTQVTLPGIGTVPQNVANICLWTWECVPPPQGPNEHANAAGYAVIAKAFLAADQ